MSDENTQVVSTVDDASAGEQHTDRDVEITDLEVPAEDQPEVSGGGRTFL